MASLFATLMAARTAPTPAAEAAMHRHTIIQEMDRHGMCRFQCRKIKKFPWLLGVAKSLDTVGCLTIREVGDGDDIAVYPELSLREVINSFANEDGVASVNCYYVQSIAKAAKILREA